MALSGQISTTSYEVRYLVLDWTATQSIPNNTSTIKWTLSGAGGTSSTRYYVGGAFKVVINGETVFTQDERIEVYNDTIIASGSTTIAHNADGSKTFSASVEAALYYQYVNVSGSGSFTLDAIPRGATITSAPNFNDEENPTINYSNVLGNNVTSLQACISLDGNKADIAYRDINKTDSSYTFTLKDSEREVLRKATTTSNSRKVIFKIKTVVNGNTFYSTSEKTLSIVNALPTLNPKIIDTNEKTKVLTGDNTRFIRYYSNASVTFGATALKGATITEQKMVCGSTTLTKYGAVNAIETIALEFSAS